MLGEREEEDGKMISTEIADDPLELEMGFLANDPARCLVINGFHQIFGDRTSNEIKRGEPVHSEDIIGFRVVI